MQRIFPEIISNRRIAENIYEMKLRGDFTAVTNPGQFVELTVDGCYLRRPISVCDAENDVARRKELTKRLMEKIAELNRL